MSLAQMPTVTLAVNGVALPAAEVRGLRAVRVQQRLSLPTQCLLTFALPPDSPDLTAWLRLGAALEVRVAQQILPLFEGEVTALDYLYGPAGERTLHVRAYDLLQRLRKRQPVRVHVDVTPASLAQELAADLGLTVTAASSGPRTPHLLQHDRNDLQLLADLAADAGLYLTLRERVLHLLTLAGEGDELPLRLGGSLLEARVEVNGAPALHSVQVVGWNPLEVEAHQAEAADAQLGRNVAAAVPLDPSDGSGRRRQVGRTVRDNRHAERLAQAELDRHAAYGVTLWGVAEGDTRLRPGVAVAVSGLHPTVSGRYVLTSVTHTLDERQGFLSELATQPPPPPAPMPRGREIATYGVVTEVDDPRRLGRVRVQLPAYADLESDWLQILLLGAGPAKGLMIVPAVGDQVLVLLPRGDAGEGIVLGGLVGQQAAVDSGVEGNLVQRFSLQTPGGQRVQLDDAGNILRLENGSGSYVELSPSHLWVHAAHDLTLEAPGRHIVIRGDAIDFERG
jgi:phage baseplate assembly protein V